MVCISNQASKRPRWDATAVDSEVPPRYRFRSHLNQLPSETFFPAQAENMPASREVHDNPDVNVLAFVPYWEGADPYVIVEFDVSSWRYVTSAPVHNPKSFDLWIEVATGREHFVVGNWTESSR